MQSFAIDDSQIKATEQIKKNPAMMEMLRKIELSKKILAEMREKKSTDSIKSQQMQEIRNKAKINLETEISKMNKDYELFTPKNSFTKFVSKKPVEMQQIYWAMFNHHQEKIQKAKDDRDTILSNGGKFQDAWNAYYKAAATTKIKIIQLNKELNIKYGNASSIVQNTFDEKGKLPRTD